MCTAEDSLLTEGQCANDAYDSSLMILQAYNESEQRKSWRRCSPSNVNWILYLSAVMKPFGSGSGRATCTCSNLVRTLAAVVTALSFSVLVGMLEDIPHCLDQIWGSAFPAGHASAFLTAWASTCQGTQLSDHHALLHLPLLCVIRHMHFCQEALGLPRQTVLFWLTVRSHFRESSQLLHSAELASPAAAATSVNEKPETWHICMCPAPLTFLQLLT